MLWQIICTSTQTKKTNNLLSIEEIREIKQVLLRENKKKENKDETNDKNNVINKAKS